MRARRRGRVVIAAALVSCVAVVGVASATIGGFNPFGKQQVAQTYANGILLPTNQWISPLGTRILDNNARLVSSTISPNGQYLAALGWNDFSGFLTIINLQTDKIVSQTGLDTGTGSAEDFSVGPDGPLFSSDGKTLWVPQSTWLAKFSFDPSTGAATQQDQIALCGSALTDPACNPNIGPSDANGAWLPSGMALSPDGNTLYVALNGNNTLGEINTQTDTLTNRIPVGNAPRQVVLADNGTVAYVSNEGGRPANKTDFTNLSDGTPIVSSRKTGGAITGTVSVVNLTTGKENTGDSGRPPADGSIPERQCAPRRQLERRQHVGDRRERQQRRPDGAHQPGARRPGWQLRERDQHVRSQSRAGQHRA